ncbi:sensor histidine kinase [Chitinophaga eiseniae]|uniref:Sensor histidine kinase n=1 Tax=Chitinophaga eiseniae TaxID=634771 RepID=A0A847SQC6_9BACT|nr:sensor histidine kinase [Chitinophaga eiseniae]NLR82504.1 sensor histidine kinase [Chitinophaga eiseniae]
MTCFADDTRNYPGMLRKIVVMTGLLCAGLFSHAQDTTLSVIQRMPDDTAKVNRLIAYGTTLLDKQDTTALRLFEQGLKISQRLHYEEGEILAYRRFGYVKTNLGAFNEAIDANKIALAYYKKKKSLINIIAAYNNIAQAFRQMEKVDSTIAYYLLGIQAVENAMLENNEEAKQAKVLSIYAVLNTNIASLYCNMQDLPKAIEYGEKGIRVAREVKDTPRLIVALVTTGHIYEVKKEYPEGMKYARTALSLATSVNEPMVTSKVFHLLSVCYTGLNLPDSAILAGRKVLYYAKGVDPQGYMSAFLDIADAYHSKKEYQQEEAILQEGVKELKVINNLAFYGRYIYEKLANAKYAQGDYKTAFDYLGKANVYKDSLLSKENRDIVAKLETQYKTVQKEKELAQKDFQLEKNRNYMYFAIAALIVTLLIVALLVIQRRAKRKLHESNLEAIQQQKELQLLQALMQGEERERSRIAKDLHDGVAGMLAATKMHFSSISDDDELVNAEGYQQGMKLLNEATKEIRKTSHNLMPEVLLQHGLDEALRRYCHSVNNRKSLQIIYDSWGDINRYTDGFELSVYRIVQELVNNIIKHSQATQAMVQVSEQDHLLSVSIEDNGVGFREDEATDGMGLRSLRARVSALNGKIDIQTSEQNGVCAYLEFEITALKTENATV